jgi:3-oxoacyl-[acyl-carrier-protein] synthase-3
MQTIAGVSIRGVSSRIPTGVVRSEDYEMLTPEERTRFARLTGIEERRFADKAQCASDFCAFAAEDVLAGLKWNKSDINLMVMVTQSPDYPIPATSIVMHGKMGMEKNCICFDVNLGCSAYPFGLAIVASMMKSLSIKRALLLVGDISTKSCPPSDKSSYPLFSDAGSATALELDETAEPMYFNLMSDGTGYEAIIIPSGGSASRVPVTVESMVPVEVEPGITRNSSSLILRGADIFNFAIREAPVSIAALLDDAGKAIKDVDFVVLHQANKLINDTIRMKIGASKESTLSTLKQYGNSSSASVPLTMSAYGDQLQKGPLMVFSGFGVGLSWGSALVRLPVDCFFSLGETNEVYGQ